MKKSILLFVICTLCSFTQILKAQVLYIEKDHSISDIEYYHNDPLCPYFVGNVFDTQESNSIQLQKFHLSECPHCYQGKDFRKSQKLYVPRYATNFVENNIISEETDSLISNQILSQKQVLGGKLLVSISHESVNNAKIKSIIEAHESENMAKVATIASVFSLGLSLPAGHYLNTYVASLRTQNCAALVQLNNNYSKTAESLVISVIIENKSDHEIALWDEKQGRTFHILPSKYIAFYSYDLFDGVLRVEDEFAQSKEISYLRFNTKNYLIKVRPYQIDKEYFFIKCPDVNTFTSHYIEADEIKKDLVSYKVSREDYIYLNTND